jgi:glycosyltransferase involved in cell wall biosynthesis
MKQKTRKKQRTNSRFPALPKISVIIPARNEAKKILSVLKNCKKLGADTELIVVANGCTDDTAEIAEKEGARVVLFQEALGHDVGRAIGAYHATGAILLFLDGDMVIPSNSLKPFLRSVQNGLDLALNAYPKQHKRYPPHPTVTAKHALNIILGRADLRAASMTCIPFAMSKRAVKTIGIRHLAIPPLAHAIAIHQGLRVGVGGYVNVGLQNPLRKRPKSIVGYDPICELILGDHLEAIHYVIQEKGVRGGFHDLERLRDLIPQQKYRDETTSEQEPKSGERETVTTIIPACNEARTIRTAVRTALRAGTDSVLVVNNGSTDSTSSIARKSGALVLDFPKRLGHDVGRAIGAKWALRSHIVVMDGDILVKESDLKPFVNAMSEHVDIALNDLNSLLPPRKQFDMVSVLKRFLNLAANRPDLGICSLTAIPHAISNRALSKISVENFAVPPLAHVIAIQKGLVVQAVHPVDVVKRNRIRPKLHRAPGKPLAKLIIGDHVEAIAYLLTSLGPRGPFPDSIRKRDILETYLASKQV